MTTCPCGAILSRYNTHGRLCAPCEQAEVERARRESERRAAEAKAAAKAAAPPKIMELVFRAMPGRVDELSERVGATPRQVENALTRLTARGRATTTAAHGNRWGRNAVYSRVESEETAA